jgi:signal transduction histidine kinase
MVLAAKADRTSGSRRPTRLLTLAIVCAAVAFAAWLLIYHYPKDSVVPSHTYQLEAANAGDWTAIGGTWAMADGVVQNHSAERGAKLLAGSHDWRNYTLNADVRFEGDGADMGVVVRSNSELQGVDAYNGYYVGMRTVDGTIVIGRSNFGWIEARPLPMPGGVHPSVWYRMRVTAYDCNIAASVENLTTMQTAYIAMEERSCVETGRIGIRSLNPGGEWRNISVAEAGLNDYMELQQKAAYVERPEMPAGPPWWTPWHVGMLFAGALVLALLAQRIYFRVEQWKVNTITQERERLAHEIHDTMAQSFAGIGYQIQGIRSSVVRADHVDSRYVADQLSVAYQLIRNCHREASRTIAMLSSFSPKIQTNLLSALEETARKIAGEQIKIVAEHKGTPLRLNLRLADALLHIGQEAIANAANHSEPTALTITLGYFDNEVELVVEDNGHGFEYSRETAGFGILGMQKRARDIGATLHILTAPGHGTQIRVKARVQQDTLRGRLMAGMKRLYRGSAANMTLS